ncbi:MAG TPA: hypothetical protein VFH61_02785 [Thermoleophilia bacterium]|nr:hypothetical protein [Thermoleophilia bacterium]
MDRIKRNVRGWKPRAARMWQWTRMKGMTLSQASDEEKRLGGHRYTESCIHGYCVAYERLARPYAVTLDPSSLRLHFSESVRQLRAVQAPLLEDPAPPEPTGPVMLDADGKPVLGADGKPQRKLTRADTELYNRTTISRYNRIRLFLEYDKAIHAREEMMVAIESLLKEDPTDDVNEKLMGLIPEDVLVAIYQHTGSKDAQPVDQDTEIMDVDVETD